MLHSPHPFEGMLQARLEELLRFAFIALKPIWRCHQFLRFGHKHCPEQVRIDSMERAAQPNIEEIGQVGVYVDTSKPDQRIAEGPSRHQGAKTRPLTSSIQPCGPKARVKGILVCWDV